MDFPYGVASFANIRRDGQLYIDRTDRIQLLESLGASLLFLRPRRFGKSLWLTTLEAYYDLRTADQHRALFDGLAMGREPTPLAHRYFVMRWDFSKINPDPPQRGVNTGIEARHGRISNEIAGYLNTVTAVFLEDYREQLPGSLELGDDPFHNLERLLALIRQTPHRLYLLIDEYDNFANEILSEDPEAYGDLVHSDGPFKYLFKWVKGVMSGAGLERLFITGVSPVVLSDITSGLNVAINVHTYPELNTLCGFTDAEVEDVLARLHRERTLTLGTPPPWEPKDAQQMMRHGYNGYRFAVGAPDAVYNPTLVLYFLGFLARTDAYPDQLLDANLAADEAKLDYLARVSSGQDAVLDLIRRDQPLEVRQLLDRFTLRSLLERSTQDVQFVGAYLFYFGMLTLRRDRNAARALELVVPNEVVRGLYIDRIRSMLLPLGASRSEADTRVLEFLRGGEPTPLLEFVEGTLLPQFSNRDATWANELTLKTLFLMLLWDEASYIAHSEAELEQRYVDLCLLRRPDVRDSGLWDLVFEFKRLSLGDLGMSGEQVKDTARRDLLALPAVQKALDQATRQLETYGQALTRRHGNALKLRSFAVVSLGFSRLVAKPIHP